MPASTQRARPLATGKYSATLLPGQLRHFGLTSAGTMRPPRVWAATMCVCRIHRNIFSTVTTHPAYIPDSQDLQHWESIPTGRVCASGSQRSELQSDLLRCPWRTAGTHLQYWSWHRVCFHHRISIHGLACPQAIHVLHLVSLNSAVAVHPS